MFYDTLVDTLSNIVFWVMIFLMVVMLFLVVRTKANNRALENETKARRALRELIDASRALDKTSTRS